LWLVGSSLDFKRAHNPKVAGSNPAPATNDDEGLADAAAANPFRLPRLQPYADFWSLTSAEAGEVSPVAGEAEAAAGVARKSCGTRPDALPRE
jgi:hypothetical protein